MWLLLLERGYCDFRPPFVGVADLSVFCGIVAEGFGERHTAQFGTDNVGRCAPVVLTFLDDRRFLVLTKRYWTLSWLEPPCQLDMTIFRSVQVTFCNRLIQRF